MRGVEGEDGVSVLAGTQPDSAMLNEQQQRWGGRSKPALPSDWAWMRAHRPRLVASPASQSVRTPDHPPMEDAWKLLSGFFPYEVSRAPPPHPPHPPPPPSPLHPSLPHQRKRKDGKKTPSETPTNPPTQIVGIFPGAGQLGTGVLRVALLFSPSPPPVSSPCSVCQFWPP